jgi:predicted molibdopterin-dependent oxidoreductase YjgC
LAGGEFAGAYIAGDDILTLTGNSAALRDALQKLSFLVVQDIRLTETAKLAHVVFPSTHFGEKEGSYTNRQGRVQKLNQAVIPPEGALQDGEIFLRLLDLSGEKLAYGTPSQIFDALAQEKSAYRGISYATLGDNGVLLGGGVAKPA